MAITQKDVIYFILTDRFHGVPNPDKEIAKDFDKTNPFHYHGGNIEGIIEKIPYLKKLGITALWITPVYLQLNLSNIHGYHGYWALDFNAVDPHFYIDNGKYPKGSKLYVKDLVDALHENGIKLVLDMVVNHTGYGHPGVENKPENPTPIRSHWFNQAGLDCSQDMIEGALASLPDLNLDNHDVCDYHVHTIISWIKETGIDAIRMDTVKHVERVFWNDYKTQIKGLYPDVSLLGEVLEFDVDRISEYQRYWAFDSLFDFPLQQAMKEVFIEDQSLHKFVSPFNGGSGILEKDAQYNNPNKLSTLLDNHDLSARFFTWAMNRHYNNPEPCAIITKLALTFMFTNRGIPQIYYGTEIGLEGSHDPDNRRDFPWEIFDTKYNVKAKHKLQKDIFDHTCDLIKIRKENDALTCGDFVCLYVDNFIIVYLRYVLDSVIITVIHNGWMAMPDSVKIHVENHPELPTRIKEMLKNKKMTCLLTKEKIQVKDGIFEIKMEGKSALILK